MKKIFSALFLAVVLTTGLVAETKMLSVNFTVPFDIHTQKLSGYGETEKYTEKLTSIGFGLSAELLGHPYTQPFRFFSIFKI